MFRFDFDPSWFEARWLDATPASRTRRGPGLLARSAERLVRSLETAPGDVSWRFPPF